MKHMVFRNLRTSVCCTAALLLTGCAHQLTVPAEVKVPVPVPCLKAEDKPARPALKSDAELLALDRYKRTLALWVERLERQAYEAKLEAAVEGCSKLPAIKP